MPRANDTAGSGAEKGRPALKERLSGFLLKPPDPNKPPPPAAKRRSVEQLEHANRYADDKERLFGLVAAPVGAAIAILIAGTQLSQHPKHPGEIAALMWELLALALIMLGTAWFRKRLFLGCATALFGLSVFNLHYWGFGVPYVLLGAWLLVRAYRAQRDLKEATGAAPRYGARSTGGSAPKRGAPEQSKRYTPASSTRRRPGQGQKAG